MKLKKHQKGTISVSKIATRNCTLSQTGNLGLMACEVGRISAIQLEASRRTLLKLIGRTNKIKIRKFINISKTKKPLEMRMGQGKGPVDQHLFRIKPKEFIFEIQIKNNLSENFCKKALKKASQKLSIKTKIL